MKRILLISLLLIVIIVVVILLFRPRGRSVELNIKVASGTQVTKVVMQKAGERVVLEEKKGNWLLNGKEEARKTAVSFLIATLEGMEPKSPVSDEVFKELTVKFLENPVSVRVFSGKRKVRSFIVFHFNDPDYGSVIRKSSKSKPYLFYLPGYDFDAGSVFTSEPDYWKPFTVFEIMPSKIKKVVFDYTGYPERSFVLVNNDGIALLQGNSSYDTIAVKRYLSYFVKIPFESITTGLEPQDEARITESQPFFILTVTTIDGRSRTLRGWKRMVGTGMDTDRLWGRVDDGRLFVMRYLDIDPLLKKRTYFLVRE